MFAICAPVHAEDTAYPDIGLGELLARLPTLFNQSVSVKGVLTGWGELAALDSEATREVMIDLRALPPELQQTLNLTCTLKRHCRATVQGKVVQIRGDGISELGLEAQSVQLEPLPEE